MSVVPVGGLVRKLYKEAAKDIEYKSASFWHGWLQRRFNEQDVYHITPEYSPDGTLRRVDACVLRYDDDHDTLSAMLWVEFKRPSGSVRDVENQARDAAVRCITQGNLQSVYVMTTVGVSFRAWTVTKRNQVLEPYHGSPADGTRLQYIDADSNDAHVLDSFVDTVKNYPPLRIAPVVPSQSLSQSGYGQSGYEEYAGLQQGYLSTGEQGGHAGESSASGMGYQGQDVVPATGEYGPTSTAGANRMIKVHVTRNKHFTRPDEYTYRDAEGRARSTTKDDWTKIMYNGKVAWCTQRRGVDYYTRDTIL